MIEKVVRKFDLAAFSEIKENLAYWLSRPPAERVAAVLLYRRLMHGCTVRIKRVARIIERPCR
jgi:hypothetical protein